MPVNTTGWGSSGHCCVCSQVCHHIGGPWYCNQHRPANLRTPQPAFPRPGDGPTVIPGVTVVSKADFDALLRRVEALEKELEEHRKFSHGSGVLK